MADESCKPLRKWPAATNALSNPGTRPRYGKSSGVAGRKPAQVRSTCTVANVGTDSRANCNRPPMPSAVVCFWKPASSPSNPLAGDRRRAAPGSGGRGSQSAQTAAQRRPAAQSDRESAAARAERPDAQKLATPTPLVTHTVSANTAPMAVRTPRTRPPWMSKPVAAAAGVIRTPSLVQTASNPFKCRGLPNWASLSHNADRIAETGERQARPGLRR